MSEAGKAMIPTIALYDPYGGAAQFGRNEIGQQGIDRSVGQTVIEIRR